MRVFFRAPINYGCIQELTMVKSSHAPRQRHGRGLEDTMARIEIRHRSTGAVLYAGDGESVLEVVAAAVQGGADLGGADLGGANLRGANLGEAKLVGSRPVMQIGPIGSRADYLIAVVTTDGVRVTAGCFSGTLDEFRAAVESTHGDSEHGRDYRAAIAMIKAHAEIWAHAAADVA